MSTWMIVLIVVAVAVVALVATTAATRSRKRQETQHIGLPPIGALSAGEPVLGAGQSNAETGSDERAPEPAERRTR